MQMRPPAVILSASFRSPKKNSIGSSSIAPAPRWSSEIRKLVATYSRPNQRDSIKKFGRRESATTNLYLWPLDSSAKYTQSLDHGHINREHVPFLSPPLRTVMPCARPLLRIANRARSRYTRQNHRSR